MKDFRSLGVWNKSHQLVLETYRLIVGFPKEERFGLADQIRRAGVSIPANIAEGCGRGTDADFARFLQIAMGSASELEYELLLAHDLGYLNEQDYVAVDASVREVKQMLTGLIKRLSAPPLTADC